MWRSDGWWKPPTSGGGGGAYVGPGDLKTYLEWGGLRAYTAGYTGPSVQVVDQADGNLATFNIGADGFLDDAAVQAWVTSHSVTDIFVVQIRDQVNGTWNWSQFTLANRAKLIRNPPGITGGKYSLLGESSRSVQYGGNNAVTASQPWTFSAVARRTIKQVAIRSGIASAAATGARFGFSANADSFYQYGGSSLNDIGSAALNTWYGIQAVFNGASSVINANGSDITNPSSPGSVALSGTTSLLFNTGSGDFMDGYISEFGIAAGTVPGTMDENMQAAWGY